MIHQNILYGYDYDTKNNILISREEISNYGVFSTFTLMITSLMVVYKTYKKTPDYIDGRTILNKIKSEKNFDMYNYLFHIDNNVDINFDYFDVLVPFGPNDHHTIYSEKYSKYYNLFFKKYFNINNNIVNKLEFLLKKYNINLENTISVVFRDSDKWTDFGGFNYVSAGAYLRKTKEILEKDNNIKVLIQSENTGVVKIFKEVFNSIFINETNIKKHSEIYPPIPLENKIEWVEYYIATLWLISKCKYVLTYTGNSSFFIYLSRGTTKNFIQEITFENNYNDFFVTNN